jgi:hypothetical protein
LKYNHIFAALKLKRTNTNGEEIERPTDTGDYGVHRAQEQRQTGYFQVYNHQKQEKYAGKIRAEEVQSDPEANDDS